MEIEEMPGEILPHSAAANWSGFIYQGRIALYHVLTVLIEKTEAELNDLFVQIDSIEDFAIIKYDEHGKIIPITMHQVKAIRSNLYSTYEDDFKQIEEKRAKTGVADVKAYFHLSTQNEKTKVEIEVLHPSLEVYCYDNDQEFCSLAEIDNKIKDKISLVLQRHNIDGHDNVGKLQLLYDVLEKKVSDRVVYIHSQNHVNGVPIRNAAYKSPIRLIEFINLISQDIADIIQDEKYFEGKIRDNLNRYYQEYCLDADEAEFTDDIKVKLDKYLYLFNSFDSGGFKSFLQNIRPHKEIAYTNFQEYTDSCLQQDETKDAFFIILKEIRESNNPQGIGWKSKDLKQYFPTSINYPNTELGNKNASERILKTALSTMIDVPFNSDFLITAACNVENIQFYANKISEIEKNESDRITNWRNIGLIDLETAKAKLND
jgi:hypothetical protein